MEQAHRICPVCGERFRRDDAIGTVGDNLVHGRCLPRHPRFADADENDSDDDERPASPPP